MYRINFILWRGGCIFFGMGLSLYTYTYTHIHTYIIYTPLCQPPEFSDIFIFCKHDRSCIAYESRQTCFVGDCGKLRNASLWCFIILSSLRDYGLRFIWYQDQNIERRVMQNRFLALIIIMIGGSF